MLRLGNYSILNSIHLSTSNLNIVYSDCVRSTWPEWLEDLKVKLDVNNKGLAALLGISPSTVGHWLSGNFRPEVAQIIGLATLAPVSPVELFAIVYDLKWDDVRDDQARYRDIVEGLEYINDEGLSLLEDQIRFVLRARFPRREAPNRGGELGDAEDDET